MLLGLVERVDVPNTDAFYAKFRADLNTFLNTVTNTGAAAVIVSAPPMPWNFEVLDGDGGTNGRIKSDALGQAPATTLYDGGPHVFYYDATNGNLRHAWFQQGRWTFETLDGNGGTRGRINANVGGTPAVLADSHNWLHVWYHEYVSGNLRHAWWDRNQWTFETLDGAGGPDGRIDAYVGLSVSAVENPNNFRLHDRAQGPARPGQS